MTSSTPLISRKIFFSNPDHVCVRLSPDGKHIAYIAPYKGVMNIWVAPSMDLNQARVLTKESSRGLASFSWAHTNSHILYSKDNEGDENWHVHSVDIATEKDVDLTPYKYVSARLSMVSPENPHKVIISVNSRVPEFHDAHLVTIETGECDVLFENNEFVGLLFDDKFNLRFGVRILSDGSTQLDKHEKGSFSKFDHVPYEDALGTNPIGFSKDGNSLFQLDSRGRNTTAFYKVDIDTQAKTLLAECPKADITDVLLTPETKEFEGWTSTYLKKEWRYMDRHIHDEMRLLKMECGGEDIEIISRTQDDKRWIVVSHQDQGPAIYYLYERAIRNIQKLFTSQKSLENLELAPMEPVIITTRDGLEMPCYCTKPVGFTKSNPVPLILMVHGGPQARDHWGYNAATQWLANRGYAVLSVNYRGSTGIGKVFTNAGDGEWSRKMHDDLLDAVNWSLDEGITTKDQICIYGGSYGGYATLVGLTYTPDVFACGVDIVGPSNLKTLMETVPAYWKPILDMLKRRVGGHLDSKEGLNNLESRSPIHKADQIKKPLLIAQGANDPRVKQAESDQFASALKARNIPVTYVLYPDEGHGFARPENKMSFYALTELFLQEHLGGRAEPIGTDFNKSTHQLLEEGPEVKKALLQTA